MLITATSAIAVDAFTTYAALTATYGGFSEDSSRVAGLITHNGLLGGVVVSALIRICVVLLVAIAAMAWPRVAPYLIAIGFAGALFTWWIALENVWTVTHP
jgi:hypothetical protein